MNAKLSALAIVMYSGLVSANSNERLQQQVHDLQTKTKALEAQLNQIKKETTSQNLPLHEEGVKLSKPATKKNSSHFHASPLWIHTLEGHPESIGFYPTALLADNHVVTYIAGTPIVTAPYLGARPAFDGSDYIVNISSINRDIRLMQQRRRLFRAYEAIGYPIPQTPIVALSGKFEPSGMIDRPYLSKLRGDLTLGSDELDVAALLNDKVEGFMAIAYDATPPRIGGPRVANSAFGLNMGFVNIGNLDQSPLYVTAGQLYLPFGRYSSAMISATLPMRLARTKARPIIFGYKSQTDAGPYAAIYGYKSDTTQGSSTVGGINWGYVIHTGRLSGDLGVGYLSSIDDAAGMQNTGSLPFTTFGGFGSLTNGNEYVHKVPAFNAHGNISFDRYSLTAEWVGAANAFRAQDLSFNGKGAKPKAAQLEAGATFMIYDKPASFAVGYQWSQESLALNLPHHRLGCVFNISLWRDTVESLEYRHDVDYKVYQYANGATALGGINENTLGTGDNADALLASIGVYF